jgi:hypothetical protein
MIYYSTGKSANLPKRGKVVSTENKSVIAILLKNGCIAETLEEEKQEPVEVVKATVKQEVVEFPKKRRGNPNFGKKKDK